MWFLLAMVGIAASVDFDGIGSDEGDEDLALLRPDTEEPQDDRPGLTGPPPPNEEGAWRDPWLEGDWDDEFISTDSMA